MPEAASVLACKAVHRRHVIPTPSINIGANALWGINVQIGCHLLTERREDRTALPHGAELSQIGAQHQSDHLPFRQSDTAEVHQHARQFRSMSPDPGARVRSVASY